MRAQCFERRLWPHQHALRQFEGALPVELLWKLEERGLDLERLWCVVFSIHMRPLGTAQTPQKLL